MVIVWFTKAFGFDIEIISKGSRSFAEIKIYQKLYIYDHSTWVLQNKVKAILGGAED